MTKENALQYDGEIELDDIELDELLMTLNKDFEDELANLNLLDDVKTSIAEPNQLGETVQKIIWEQFITQVGLSGAEIFVKNNNGMKLDLRNSAHIQTTDSFKKGKIASHNIEIDYNARYQNYRTNLDGGARIKFDKDRNKGSKSMHKDHIVPVAEIANNANLYAHVDEGKIIDFANSSKNIHDLPAAANMSKKDKKMRDWLSKEKNGVSTAERYGVDERELLKKDDNAREELKKIEDSGLKESKKMGKKSQKDEAFRISGAALKTLFIQLLSELLVEIMGKLIKWLMEAKKSLETLIAYIKEAILSFIYSLKKHLLNAGSAMMTTIIASIIGPVVGTLKKIWIFMKQGYSSMKEAIEYLKKPGNQGKDPGILILELGKIITGALTAAGSILLGEAISKGLTTIPAFSVEIPMVGSLAELIGIFMGGAISGIMGAIMIHYLDTLKKRISDDNNLNVKIDSRNKTLDKQVMILNTYSKKLVKTRELFMESAKDRNIEFHNRVENLLSETAQSEGLDYDEGRQVAMLSILNNIIEE